MAHIPFKVMIDDHTFARLNPNDIAVLEEEFCDWWETVGYTRLDEIIERENKRKHKAAGRTKAPVLVFRNGPR